MYKCDKHQRMAIEGYCPECDSERGYKTARPAGSELRSSEWVAALAESWERRLNAMWLGEIPSEKLQRLELRGCLEELRSCAESAATAVLSDRP